MSSIEPNWTPGWSPDMMCRAHSCPLRWSVNASQLCEFHAWRPEHEWPAITDSQWAFKSARESQPGPHVRRMSDHQKRETVQALREAVSSSGPLDPKAWAKKLKARHEAGERLNSNQIRCFRDALGTPLSEPERDHIGRDGVMSEQDARTPYERAFDEAMAT